MPLDVTWIDEDGSQHVGGRPECLPPASGVVEDVRFAGQRVDLRGGGHLQVVAVFCEETLGG